MFYVYTYQDPRPSKKNEFIYVGKGKGNRAWVHWEKGAPHNAYFQAVLNKIRRAGLEPIITIVQDNLQETDAFALEVALIAKYGRRNLGTGSLLNLTEGGDGRVGFAVTEEFLERMREVGNALWSKPGYREKVVAAQKAVQGTPERKQQRIELSRRAYAKRDPKLIENLIASRKTPESRAKTSAQSKAMWADPAHRAYMQSHIRHITSDPVLNASRSEKVGALWKDPDFHSRMMAARANGWVKMSKRVGCVHDGVFEEFASVTAACNITGVGKGTMINALKSGKPITKGKFAGWVFKYLDPSTT